MLCIRFVALACVLSIALTTGCAPTLAPVYSPQSQAGVRADGQPYTAEEVEAAILRGLADKRWLLKERGQGFVLGEVSAGGHTAQVRIVYAPDTWRILHDQTSPGLKYGTDERHGDVIHRRYNHWVRLLDEAIRNQLAQGGAAPAAPAPAASLQTPVDATTTPAAVADPTAGSEAPVQTP